ncbi:hypothetical protein A3D66_01440 [Candidatus Kaiserbacteria bacterium RIFCSPHIGHO2_02_FULL_50_9]|uniref:Flavodoxin domain-containing protein n=1 Tax=Candidatus Kaiserbacteria bacterium RIFCSPLOWO2_01_FULL_51_21 TaxID=1798508 RepID=A0A1F6ECY6_9BACT|nr:MAG: hypothetical protein A2761_01995 [Candidatus Kaiserbacteria bacterium RIFCSPHIGHO2_01_FULL_51_33]OGG63712.1 MAG: hypothetical protein A3D66_01440 [Candidatus Kaiserbacteria bacterium RIFCSPHIGHO2_02_FULL_50_9]OGG71518.1 MAG: hypothetical protein A3A35_02170 [Candidatus Kaiserbacteria bacterium RIFCSPLOWO2_01_FULL_51_21]
MNKRTVVLYQSKYGSTKQYAEWLGESLGAPVFSIDGFSPEKLVRYDLVIVGGWIRIGKITCADFIAENWNLLKDKQVVVYSVSATKPGEPEVLDFYKSSFPLALRERIRFFPLWGRFRSADMADKFLMLVPKTALRIKLLLAPTEGVRSRYQGITERFDHVERTALQPLIEYCKSLEVL